MSTKKRKNKIVQIALIIVISCIGGFFLYGDIVYFVKNYKGWYIPPGRYMYLSEMKSNRISIPPDAESRKQVFNTGSDVNRGLVTILNYYSDKDIDTRSVYVYLHDDTCDSLIDSVPLRKHGVTDMHIAEFRQPLQPDSQYCFSVKNETDIVTVLWLTTKDNPESCIINDEKECTNEDIYYELIEVNYFEPIFSELY